MKRLAYSIEDELKFFEKEIAKQTKKEVEEKFIEQVRQSSSELQKMGKEFHLWIEIQVNGWIFTF